MTAWIDNWPKNTRRFVAYMFMASLMNDALVFSVKSLPEDGTWCGWLLVALATFAVIGWIWFMFAGFYYGVLTWGKDQ